MLVFACLVPHPPILLPNVGSKTDRAKVQKTINSMKKLGAELGKAKPDLIIISSPHPDWGFNVPLHFLNKNVRGIEVKTQLTDFQSPQVHFEKGKQIAASFPQEKRIAWIASGDMSHKLKEDGPYGLHSSGKKFDERFIKLLKAKDIDGILNLDPQFIEEAGECGLRSFCLLLGALKGSKTKWKPNILSYEAPFGVGYLVADLEIEK
ncbi:hypothetical protein ACFL0Y_04770 [Patescibacteria group bacterium]